MRLIDADMMLKELKAVEVVLAISADRKCADYAVLMQKIVEKYAEETPIDAEPVVRCKDCVFFRDKHVLTDDGQRKSYAEFPPEAFSLLGDGGVTGSYGINVGSQCLVDCNIGYSDDKTVFRGPDEFCARAVKKMDGGTKDENA